MGPLGRILGDEVGVEPGDAALVILEEDKGGGAVYLAEVELHFNKAQLKAFQGHDEGAVAWSADRVAEGTEEVSNFIGSGRRVTRPPYKPTWRSARPAKSAGGSIRPAAGAGK